MKLSSIEKIGNRAKDLGLVTMHEDRNGIKTFTAEAEGKESEDVTFSNLDEVGQHTMKTKTWMDAIIEDEVVQDAINHLAQDKDKRAVEIKQEYDDIFDLDVERQETEESKMKSKSRSNSNITTATSNDDDNTANTLKEQALGSKGNEKSLAAYVDILAKGDGNLTSALRALKKHALGKDGDEDSFDGYIEYILAQRKKGAKKATGNKGKKKKAAPKKKAASKKKKVKLSSRKSTVAVEEEEDNDSTVPEFKLCHYDVKNIFDRNNVRDHKHNDLQFSILDVRTMFDPSRNYCMDAAVEQIHANPVDDFESLVDEE